MRYAVNGRQYIVGTGADTLYAFALPDQSSARGRAGIIIRVEWLKKVSTNVLVALAYVLAGP